MGSPPPTAKRRPGGGARLFVLTGSVLALAAHAQPLPSATKTGTLYAHPLLSDEGQAAIEKLRESGIADPEALLARLSFGDSFEIDEQGVVVEDGSFVTIVEVEADADRVDAQEPVEAVAWVSPSIDRALAEAEAGVVTVMVTVRQDWYRSSAPNLARAVETGIVSGTVLSEADAALTRDEFLLDRTEEGVDALAPLSDLVADCGGKVLWTHDAAMLLAAEVPVACIDVVEASSDVATLTALDTGVADAGYTRTIPGSAIDGLELEDLLQSTPFYLEGYGGSANLGYTEWDGSRVFLTNPGFNDASGTSRVHPMECIFGVGCWDVDYDPGMGHPTGVVSILAGDVTLGQDSAVTGAAKRRQLSGVARESEVWTVPLTVSADVEAVFMVHGAVAIAAASASVTYADPLCEGRDGYSVAWNMWYEQGVALFKSASNDGHTSTSDCLVSSPGSAIGVFAVAASTVDGSAAGDPEILDIDSPRGGTSTEGRGRTIIGLTGPTRMSFPYPHYAWPVDSAGVECRYGPDWNGVGCDGEDFPNTSAATPAVAGSAELFRDWYTTEKSALMNEPGILYANMLLMGDRADKNAASLPPAVPLVTGYDNLWGAGELRLRKFDGEGFDNPARYTTGKTCVAHGAATSIPMTPNSPMPQNVGILKATAWWYDHRHDDALSVDNDRVRLEVLKGAASIVTDNGTDNKARVSVDTLVAGEYYYLRMTGTQVTSDVEGCGTDSTMVYWAYYWEDTARDDGDQSDYARPE